jgi:hypothetical protein
MTGAPIYVIVGAPRSGTSALALSFKEQGIPMFVDADPPDRQSPSGNQEDRQVRLLNNALMGENGLGELRDWDNPHYAGSTTPKAARLIGAYVAARSGHAGRAAWGVKDPRLCFLIEPWHAATQGLPVSWIYIHRVNREASIGSLIQMLPEKLRDAGDSDSLYRLASNWLESYHLASQLGFHRAGIEPYRITYESLLTSAGQEEIAAHFGFRAPIRCIDPRLNRQARTA